MGEKHWQQTAGDWDIRTRAETGRWGTIDWWRKHAELFQTVYGVLRTVAGFRVDDYVPDLEPVKVGDCLHCGAPVLVQEKLTNRGRKRKYCSTRCRTAAYRAAKSRQQKVSGDARQT